MIETSVTTTDQQQEKFEPTRKDLIRWVKAHVKHVKSGRFESVGMCFGSEDGTIHTDWLAVTGANGTVLQAAGAQLHAQLVEEIPRSTGSPTSLFKK